MRPLQLGAASFPAAALRGDLGVILSCARFGPQMLSAGLVANKLTAPFGKLVQSAGVTDPWLLAWLDLECFGEREKRKRKREREREREKRRRDRGERRGSRKRERLIIFFPSSLSF